MFNELSARPIRAYQKGAFYSALDSHDSLHLATTYLGGPAQTLSYKKDVFSAIGSVNGHLLKLRTRASRAFLKNQPF